MDYGDKLPPSPQYIFTPPRRYIFTPPLTPGEYPDGLLRTVQRRVKVWRKEKATAMVFGEQGEMPTEESIPASREMI